MWRGIHGEKGGMRAPRRQTNVPVRLQEVPWHGDAHWDRDKMEEEEEEEDLQDGRWKLLPVSLGWSCRGGSEGDGMCQHGLQGVCGDGLCILGQLQVCQKAGKGSALQNLRQTFPRPHGVTADSNR